MAGEGRIFTVNALLVSLATVASTRQCCGLLILQRLRQKQYIVTRTDPGLAGYPTFKRLHGKMRPRLGGSRGLADRAIRLTYHVARG